MTLLRLSRERRARERIGALGLALVSTLGVMGCPSDEKCAPRVVTTTQACSTTADCVDAGFKGLTCLNGTCGRECTRDDECALPTDDEDPACRTASSGSEAFICERQVCLAGCPDVPCAAGESCVEGRCAIFFEGFELPEGQDVVTPKSLGWDDTTRELENRETTIVFAGVEGCSRGDDRCAGPAGAGDRFLALERVPTPERGTPETAVSCRACACCLECRLNPPRDGALSTIPTCPGAIDAPEVLACAADVPPVCSAICDACSDCVAAPMRALGDGLLSCERDVGTKACGGCVAYDACVARELDSRSCSNAAEPCSREADCRGCIVATCDPMRPACFACADAAQCEREMPGSSACRTLRDTCDAQGEDGCFATPIARPRSALTDDEQALVSPKIAGAAGVAGPLVLSFEYVAFDIRERWRRVLQGQPRSTWPEEEQEIAVQLCGGSCDQPSSWVDATRGGVRVSFPPASQRRNGVSFGGQSSIDWRSNRVEVEIPDELRSAELRFRFVPRLEDDARVGLDNILVRRR